MKHIHQEPRFIPNTISIAWTAGIYEGEGTCDCSSGLRVSVVQKDKWLLNRLIELYGGVITSPPSWEGVSRWLIYGQYAAGFLMTIYKFLSPKRQEQIKLALDTWKQIPGKAALPIN